MAATRANPVVASLFHLPSPPGLSFRPKNGSAGFRSKGYRPKTNLRTAMEKQTRLKNLLFISITGGIGVLMFLPLMNLLHSKSGGMYYEYYSHIYLIPLVSAYLLYDRRKEIRKAVKPAAGAGATLAALGIIGYGAVLIQGPSLAAVDAVSGKMAALLTAWLGGFLLFFGARAFRSALFPLLFLFFTVPLPSALMDNFIYALQVGSTWATALIFNLLGTSYFREGFVFQMGPVTIEVAKQCSGIRSTMAMVITGVLAAHLFLRRPWSKLVLMLTILPITVFKNGLRIVILTLLAIHVDERFLTGGFLHKSGGFLFYIPGLIVFGGILLLLRKGENRGKVKG
jgi:exosortase